MAATKNSAPTAAQRTDGIRLVVDNTRRTDCFTDGRCRPIAGSPTLLPCPFCDSIEELQINCVRSPEQCEWDEVPSYHVLCENCCADGPWTESPQKAAELWNRRNAGDAR